MLIALFLLSALACRERQSPPPDPAPATPVIPADRYDLEARRPGIHVSEGGCRFFHQIGELALEAYCFQLWGRQLWKNNDPRSARDAYAQSLAFWRKLGDLRGVSVLEFDLADVERRLGHSGVAHELLLEAAELAKKNHDPLHQARVLTALGSLYHYSGETSWAIHELRTALPLLDQSPKAEEHEIKRQKAITLSQLAAMLPFQKDVTQKDFDEALTLLDEANELRRELREGRGMAVTVNNRGLVYERMGRFQDALAAYQEALARFSQPGPEHAVVSANRCRALDRLGKTNVAHTCYEKALADVRSVGYQNAEAQLLYELAESERRRGRLDMAQTTIQQGVLVVERMRRGMVRDDLRTSFLAKQYDVYELAIDLALDRYQAEPLGGHDRTAFFYAEGATARSFIDGLSAPDPETMEILTAQDVQQLLDQETLFLEYHLGETRSAVWAITKSEISCHLLPGREEIEAVARKFSAALRAGSHKIRTHNADSLGKELSRLIFAPVAAKLDRPKIVVVAPGALAYVPFAALPDPTKPAAEKPQPMLIDHRFYSVPSASAIAAIHRRQVGRQPAEKLLAIVAAPELGDDNRQGPSLLTRQLAYAAEEAWSIFGLAKGDSTLALGFAANRRFVLDPDLRNYQILHFATHGFLDDSHGQLSGLALSPFDAMGNRADGFLRAYEISPLDLPADLVVLSACETALGEEIRGEGMVGLTRAFLQAGARQVLVSLWRVDDEATARLMESFYQAHLRTGLPPDEALYRAQIELWQGERWSAPYYWAPFILQGDWLKSPRSLPRRRPRKKISASP